MDGTPRGEILVIDDDEAIRQALVDTLEDEGYPVFAVADGQAALDRLRRGARPSLILLDLMMPVMDGWRFADELRKDPELARIPVVVLTADGRVRDKARELAADGWIAKPVELEELLEVVGKYCGDGAATSSR